MANQAFTDLLPFMLPELPGCSDPLAALHLQSSVIEFCKRSKIWRSYLDPIDMVAAVNSYDIELMQGTALVEILSCRIGSHHPLRPTTADKLDAEWHNWQVDTGHPKWYLQTDPSALLLAPVPECNLPGAINVAVALMPSRTATYFPQWISDIYQDGLLSGAKARLMRQIGRPWSNPGQSQLEQDLFDRAVADATMRAAGSLVRAPQRTKPQH